MSVLGPAPLRCPPGRAAAVLDELIRHDDGLPNVVCTIRADVAPFLAAIGRIDGAEIVLTGYLAEIRAYARHCPDLFTHPSLRDALATLAHLLEGAR